jgi:hypothetical protein
MVTGLNETLHGIGNTPNEINPDTAIKLIMADNLKRIRESLERLSDSPITKNQAE